MAQEAAPHFAAELSDDLTQVILHCLKRGKGIDVQSTPGSPQVLATEVDLPDSSRVRIMDDLVRASRGYWDYGLHTDLARRTNALKQGKSILSLFDPDARDYLYLLFTPEHITGRTEVRHIRTWADNALANGKVPALRPTITQIPVEHSPDGEDMVIFRDAIFPHHPEENLLLSSLAREVRELRQVLHGVEQSPNT